MLAANRILLIDDDQRSRHDLETILKFLGEVTVVCSSINWRQELESQLGSPEQICAALIGRINGDLKSLLEDIHGFEAGIPFVLATGGDRAPDELHPDILMRISAVLTGTLSYQPLLDALHKARLFHEHHQRLRETGRGRDYDVFHNLVGNSDAIQRVRYMMSQVADKEVSVLISGESGTGKEVVARNLHASSARADQPFVPINCGAIPQELLESELFGHERGAFTGAVAARAGRFEQANGGTLFLDEIGDMPLSMQVKLLRVLQERSFERVGGIKTIEIDVRILAATHKDLEQMINRGEFREDLYYRLNVFPIDMPPLRARSSDIPLLLNELISEMEAEKRGSVRFNSAAIRCLGNYSWPGNVRELANLVERMAILHPHGIVGVSELPARLRQQGSKAASRLPAGVVALDGSSLREEQRAAEEMGGTDESMLPLSGLDLKNYLANLEKDLISQALKDSEGVVARAAQRLNIQRTTLVEKMRKYKLSRPNSKGDEQATGS